MQHPLRILFSVQKVFMGVGHNGNWLVLLSKDYVMGLTHMNYLHYLLIDYLHYYQAIKYGYVMIFFQDNWTGHNDPSTIYLLLRRISTRRKISLRATTKETIEIEKQKILLHRKGEWISTFRRDIFGKWRFAFRLESTTF